MADYDGSVRIQVDADDAALMRKMATLNERLNRQLVSLEKAKSKVEELRAAYEKLTAPGAMSKEAQKTQADLAAETAQVERLQKALESARATQQQYNELARAKAAAGVHETDGERMIRESMDTRVRQIEQELATATANAERLAAALREAQLHPETSEEAQQIAEKLRLATLDVERLSGEAQNTKDRMGELGASAEDVEESVDNAASAMERMTSRMSKIAKAAVVFFALRKVLDYARKALLSLSGLSAVTNVFSDFNNKMQQAYQKNVLVQNALAMLRGALYTAFAPIYSVVVPALVTLITWITRAITAVASFIAALTGKSFSDMASQAGELASGIEGVGGAAKKANKQLAAFDKLNVLNEDSGGGGGGGGSKMPEPIPPKDNEANEFGKRIADIIKKIRDAITGNLPAINALLGTFEFAIGAIMTFSGANIPLGLVLMAAGARRIYKSATENWGGISPKVQEAVGEILGILGGFMLALGVLLLLMGHPGAGVGLILGALASGTALAINWDSLDATVQNKIQTLMAIVATGFLAIGAILLFAAPAAWKLGLALVIAGAGMLGLASSLDWDAMKNKIATVLSTLLYIASGALLVIGLMLALAGSIPLGIALMAAGVLAYATAVALDWNAMPGRVDTILKKLLLIAGGAMVVLGLMLVCSGVALPIGIALLAAGGASLVAGASLNWNIIAEKIRGVWDGIKNWWNSNVAIYFTRDYWQEKINNMLNIQMPHIPMPHFQISYEPVDSGNYLARMLGITSLPHLSISWYAEGGFPDTGSLFVAGEAGPELVGSFGGHNNSVINEAQLVQAFRSATSEQTVLLRQQNALLTAILERSGTVSFKPSAAAGRVFSQSINMYSRQMG